MTPQTELSPTELAALVDEDCCRLKARILTYLELVKRGHKQDKYTLAFALNPDAFIHLYRLFAIPGVYQVRTIKDVDDLPIQPPELENYPHFCTYLKFYEWVQFGLNLAISE